MEQGEYSSSGSGEVRQELTESCPLSKIRREIVQAFPKRETKRVKFGTGDAISVLVLVWVAFLVRAWRIHYPSHAVYDEVRFGEIINSYLSGTYFHDVHPPLAKFIMATLAYFADYDGRYKMKEYVMDKKYPTVTYVALRLTPAFFSSLCVPLTYFSMRLLLSSPFASFVASLCVVFDPMLAVESRFILPDGLVHFFACLALFSVFFYENLSTWKVLLFEGVCLGMAVSSKYTSAGILLLAILRQFQIYKVKRSKPDYKLKLRGALIRSIILCVMAFFIHFLCVYLHLVFLPFAPPGDVPMPACVERSLVSRAAPNWEERNKNSILRQVLSLSLLLPRTRTESHIQSPYASRWYSWPLLTGKWVVFWEKDDHHIICLGNMLVWYPVFACVVANFIRVLLENDYESELTALLLGYLVSFLPFAIFSRNLFLYHYAIPLIIGYWNLAVMIEKYVCGMAKTYLFCLVCVLAVVGFWIWSPFVYGLTVPDFDFLVWNQRWRV